MRGYLSKSFSYLPLIELNCAKDNNFDKHRF